ncbi:MAG: MarR family winged helix-turn-helix transcriptional regulator [Xanthobacteraceae bacterium]
MPTGKRHIETKIGTSDYRRLAAFRHALRRFLAFSEAAARDAGVTPQQHQALLAIKGAPTAGSITVGYLAGQLLLQPHSAAELADRMVNGGLLVREGAPDDRRRVVLSLAPAAEKALHALSAAHIRELRHSAPVLDSLFDVLKPARTKSRGTRRAAVKR